MSAGVLRFSKDVFVASLLLGVAARGFSALRNQLQQRGRRAFLIARLRDDGSSAPGDP
jgi:hypothetical protein